VLCCTDTVADNVMLIKPVHTVCIVAMFTRFRILHSFIDPGHILVEDGEADVELGCREDLEYVVLKLDDTLQNGR
jgi:hypothetical protein